MNAFLWALLTACIWGVVPLMEKAGLSQAPPTLGVIVRSMGVVIGLGLAWVIWRPWTAMQNLGWSSILLLAGGGFLASFIGQLAFYRALQSGSISQVVPVAGAYPLIAAFLGWVIWREPITMSRVIGVLLVIAGVVLLRQ